LNQAQALLAQFSKVREEAQQRSRGQLGTLSVVFSSAAMWSGLLPRLLQRFQNEFPNATMELQSMRSALQREAVRSGRADIGFVATAPAATSRDIETTCVSEEPTLLVIPNSHPLSRKRRITPRDLDGVRWILLSESLSREQQDHFFAACARAGFQPQVAQRVTEPLALLALVASGLGLGLIRGSARNFAPRSLNFVALPWLTFKSRTYMIRPAAGRQPLAEAFAAYVPEIKVSI
jgi:DNA-binding transcriptional LysR family regulator